MGDNKDEVAERSYKGLVWTALLMAVVAAWSYLIYIRSDDYLLVDCMEKAKDKWVAQMCRYEFGDLKPKENMKFVMLSVEERDSAIHMAVMDTDERKSGVVTLYNDDIDKIREALAWHAGLDDQQNH